MATNEYVPPEVTSPDTLAAAVPTAGTLQDVESARFVHAISEGECVGLANAANPLESVFFNGTAVQNVNGSYNFGGIVMDQRYGTATQPYVPGFSAAETTVAIGTQVTKSYSVVHTVTSSLIDSARVILQFPLGLQHVDDSGNAGPVTVAVNIYTKLTVGSSWTLAVNNDTISGKAEANFEKAYYITRPSGTTSADGTFDIKVERVTADTTTPTTTSDQIWFYRCVEIQDAQQSYPNTAYVALSFDARHAPNSFPQTFDFIGIKVRVPSNYNSVTRAYTGVWDGTFTPGKVWTDNPAYHLYDFLTNTRYGLGSYFDTTKIDLASFYAAGVYNDAGILYDSSGNYVSGGVPDGSGGYEPRFRFNTQITAVDDAWKMLQNMAGVFNASIYVGNSLITLVQDRPTSASVLVTKANVSAEGFTYSGGSYSNRFTAARVTYNDAARGWQQTTIIEQDLSTGYPFNAIDLTAWGCTSQGQSRRVAKWAIDTNLRNTDLVTYKAPMNHCNVGPGTVIKLMDSDYAGSLQHASVVSVSGTTVVLDQPVVISSGVNLLDVLLADGATIQQATITNGAGTYSTLTISTALSQAVSAQAPAIVTGNIAPRYFRVININEDRDGHYEVTALQYDSTKYNRIESTVANPGSTFYDSGYGVIPDAVTGITFALSSGTATDTVLRNLDIKWNRSNDAVTYVIQYGMAGQQMSTVSGLGTTLYTIPNVVPATYTVNLYAVSKWGQISPVASSSYTVNLNGTSTAVINPVTNLQAVGGGTAFSTKDLNVQWVNPSSNLSKNPALKDFVVNVYTTSGTLLRTEVIAGVSAGSSQTYTYTYTKNLADNGNVPIRNIRIDVLARDTLNALASATSQTFTNAAPAIPTNISVTGGVGAIMLKYDLPTDLDFAGVLVWMSTSSSFTPSSGNLIYDGTDNFQTITAVTGGTTYYFKFAAYDTFGKSYAGTGLIVSAAYSTTPVTNAGIPQGPYLPGTGSEGSLFYNTSDGQLYRYHNGAWTAAVDATAITGQLTASQIASVNAAQLAGQITGTQITDGAISTAKLSAASITGYNIAGYTITANNIASRTLTAGNIAAGAITGYEISGNTITGNNIAAGTITAANIQSGTITASSGIIGSAAITSAMIGSLQVQSLHIANGSVSATYSSSTSSNSTSVNVTLPANCQTVTAFAFGGMASIGGGGKDGGYYVPATTSVYVTAYGGSTQIVSNTSLGSTAFSVSNPSAGSWTFYATRGDSGATSYTGSLTVVVLATYK